MAGVRGQANRNLDRERQGVPIYLLPPHWLSSAAGPGASQAAENRTA